jgi:hypothetical protein
MATQIPKIEKYIREMIANNCGSFNREEILAHSKEWMEKFPVEFNSVLNMIEAEGRNVGCDEMMDDSTPSVAYQGGYHGCYDDDSTPSVAYHGGYHGGYADDSTPSVAFGGYHGGYADDSTPSVAPHHNEYGDNIAPDNMSSVVESPMGSDHIDSSPGGYPDDDFESYTPLQRTMSCTPPRK